MTPSLIAAALWFLVAIGGAMLPSRDRHWRFAYGLMALGLPLLVWVWWENGWSAAAVVVIAAASVLRWPLIHALRWLRARLGR